jgi:hypothetical protein
VVVVLEAHTQQAVRHQLQLQELQTQAAAAVEEAGVLQLMVLVEQAVLVSSSFVTDWIKKSKYLGDLNF